jgi:membrane associated rhomboid family serine protease
MLPLRDTIRSTSFPIINWALIGLNTVVFLFEATLSPSQLDRLVMNFGVIPARLHLLEPGLLLSNPAPLITLFTHMFLHGGWLHFLSNIWVLFIFGDNVEDRMGPGRYLGFYLLSGLIAALTQVFIDPASTIPSIGASGAIAGVLGAYFLMFPEARVITLIPVFILPWIIEVRAIIFLGFWFVTQLFSGISVLALPHSTNMGGVAWWAHIGGFLFGMIFYRLFTPRRHPAYTRQYPDEYWPW